MSDKASDGMEERARRAHYAWLSDAIKERGQVEVIADFARTEVERATAALLTRASQAEAEVARLKADAWLFQAKAVRDCAAVLRANGKMSAADVLRKEFTFAFDAEAFTPPPPSDPRREVGAVVEANPGDGGWIVLHGEHKDCQRDIDTSERDAALFDFNDRCRFLRWATPEECARHGIPYIDRTPPAPDKSLRDLIDAVVCADARSSSARDAWLEVEEGDARMDGLYLELEKHRAQARAARRALSAALSTPTTPAPEAQKED